jgi:hypothetical protein
MNIESKVWNTTRTGSKIHAFGEDGTALCRSSIKAQRNVVSNTDKAGARKMAVRTPGVTICEPCEGRFQASIDAEAADHSEPVKRALVKPEVAPEVIAAVHALRGFSRGETGWAVRDAIKTLDNAGIFAAVDAVTKCTCPPDERRKSGTDNHYIECPEAPVAKCTCLAGPTGRDNHHANCPETPVSKCTCPQGGFTRPRGTHRPECPEAPVAKCTCPAAMAHHLPGCPGDPATVNECTCPIKGGSCVVDGRVMEQVVHMDGCPQAPSVVPGWGRAVEAQQRMLRARSAARGDDGAAVRMRNARAEGGFGLGTGQVTEAPETVQCGHCFGDYKPKQDGTLRRHGCWRYDLKLETIVYGELDVHGRNNL